MMQQKLPDANTHIFINVNIPVSLIKRMNGKGGRVLNLSHKRLNYTLRCAISAKADIRTGAISLPDWVCQAQSKQIRVNDVNLKQLQEYIAKGKFIVSLIVDEKGRIIDLSTDGSIVQRLTTLPLKVGWTVFVSLEEGDVVICNRQPSLHEASMNAHFLDKQGNPTNSAQMGEDQCIPYNGDFDGDTMAFTFLRSIAARVEAIMLMNVANNYVCTTSHSPIFQLNQNSLLGCYLLTQPFTKLSAEHVRFLLKCYRILTDRILKPVEQYSKTTTKHSYFNTMHMTRGRDVSLVELSEIYDSYATHYKFPEKRVNRPEALNLTDVLGSPDGFFESTGHPYWSGHRILSLVLPIDFYYKKKQVRIVNGWWYEGRGTKDVFIGQRSLFHVLWRYYGKQTAVDVQAEFAAVAVGYLEHIRGFTCGLYDTMLAGRPLDTTTVTSTTTSTRKNEMEFSSLSSSSLSSDTMATNEKAEEQRQKLMAAIDESYKQLTQYLTQPGVLEQLREDDINEAYAKLQQWAEQSLYYMGDLNQALSDIQKNHAMLMSSKTGAGSKGNPVNTTTMASTLGFRRKRGRILGQDLNASRRRSTGDRVGERTASSAGMVKNGFVSGLTDGEFTTTNKVDRIGIYDAADMSTIGYKEKQYDRHAGSVAVAYDGTVRDAAAIVQLRYGGDGCHAKYMLKVHLDFCDYSFTTAASSTTTNACLCEACKERLYFMAKMSSLMLDTMALKPYHGMKSKTELAASGVQVLLSIDASDLLDQYLASHLINTTESTTMTEEEVHQLHASQWLALKQLMENIDYVSLNARPIELKLHLSLVFDMASEKMQRLKHREDLVRVFNAVFETYVQHMAEPGDAVGISMSQDGSEPSAQMKLRAFNAVVTTENAAKHLTEGFAHFQELISDTTEPKYESNMMTTTTLDPAWVDNEDKAQVVRSQLERVVFGDIASTCHVLWLNMTNYAATSCLIEPSSNNDDEEEEEDDGSDSPISNTGEITEQHVLKTPLCMSVLSSYACYEVDNMACGEFLVPERHPVMLFSLDMVKLQHLYGAVGRVYGSGDDFDLIKTVNRMLSRGLLPWQRGMLIGGPGVYDACPYYWCMWCIYSDYDAKAEWMSFTTSTAAVATTAVDTQWNEHLASLMELGTCMLGHWIISGSLTHNLKCNDITPPSSTSSLTSVPSTTLEEPINEATIPCLCDDGNDNFNNNNQLVASSLESTLWIKRVWPKLVKQFHIRSKHGLDNYDELVQQYPCLSRTCQQTALELPAEEVDISQEECTQRLKRASYLAQYAWIAPCSVDSTTILPIIFFLKSPKNLVESGVIKIENNASNVGVEFAREAVEFCKSLNAQHLFLVNPGEYTDVLYKSYQLSCGANNKRLSDNSGDALSINVYSELWHAEDFLHDWWSNAMIEPFIVVHKDDDDDGYYSQMALDAVDGDEVLAQSLVLMPKVDTHNIVARRLNMKARGDFLIAQRSVPKTHCKTIRFARRTARKNMTVPTSSSSSSSSKQQQQAHV